MISSAGGARTISSVFMLTVITLSSNLSGYSGLFFVSGPCPKLPSASGGGERRSASCYVSEGSVGWEGVPSARGPGQIAMARFARSDARAVMDTSSQACRFS